MALHTYTDIATRDLIVTLKSLDGKSSPEVAYITGLQPHTVNSIYTRAIERGFDPNIRPIIIKDEWLKDAPQSSRPSKQTTEIKEKVVSKVQHDCYRREKSCAYLASELSSKGLDISAITI
jgi:hypothetical protein